MFTEPENGCSQVKPPPYALDNASIWIAVIVRYPCQFDQKVHVILFHCLYLSVFCAHCILSHIPIRLQEVFDRGSSE